MISASVTDLGIVVLVVVVLLAVAYGVKMARSGQRGRPQGPM